MSIPLIAAITNAYHAYQTGGQNKSAQVQGFQDLDNALQSGNLTAAQNAFAALQQLLPNSPTGNQTQNGQQGSNQNPFATDLDAVGQALQSGKLSGAQKAFAKLKQDMQLIQGRHHYHHYNGAANTQSTRPTTSNSSTGSNAGSSINITA